MTVQQTAPTVRMTDYIDSRGWTRTQKIILVLGALAFMGDGLANLILGIATPGILAEWGLTRASIAPVAAIGLAGVAIGSVVGGAIGDRLGRRMGLIGSVVLFSVMTFAVGFTGGITSMAILRFLAGLGIGAAIPNCAALLTETAPRSRRALIIGLAMAFIPVGGMAAGLVGAALFEPFGWRSLFFASGIICAAIAVLFVFFLPESPNFLIQRPERHDQLVALLTRLTGPVEPGTRFHEPVPSPEERRLSGLLAPSVRLTSISIWVGFFGCLLATYTIFTWLPSLLHGRGFSLTQSSAALVAFNGGSTVGAFVAGFISQRFGPRLATLGTSSIATLIAAGLAFTSLDPSSQLGLGAILAVLGLLLACMHNGFYTIAAEAYPPVLRAFGIGATSACGRLGAIASSFTGALTITSHEDGALYFLAIAVVLAVSFGAVIAGRPKPAAD